MCHVSWTRDKYAFALLVPYCLFRCLPRSLTAYARLLHCLRQSHSTGARWLTRHSSCTDCSGATPSAQGAAAQRSPLIAPLPADFNSRSAPLIAPSAAVAAGRAQAPPRPSEWSPPPDSPGQASAPAGAAPARGPNPKTQPAQPADAQLANGPAENGGGGVGQGAAAAEQAAAAAAAMAAAVAAAQRGGGGDATEAMAAVRTGLARLVEAVGPDQEVWYYLDPQARRPRVRGF